MHIETGESDSVRWFRLLWDVHHAIELTLAAARFEQAPQPGVHVAAQRDEVDAIASALRQRAREERRQQLLAARR